MACNVFGNPITDSTLAGMPEYDRKDKTIEVKHRARVAYNMKNAESKDVNALRFLKELQKESSTSGQAFTLCLVYNASGDALKYVTDRDWLGHIGQAPYPVEIANGQWGAFLHVGFDGSKGAVVYRTKNETAKRDWMISWSNPPKGTNHAFSDLRKEGFFKSDEQWSEVKNKLENFGRFFTEVYEGYETTVCIGQDCTSIYEAIITLSN